MRTKEQVLEIIKEIFTNVKDEWHCRDEIIENVCLPLISQIETEVKESQVRKLVWVNNSAIAFKYGTEHPIRYDVDKYGKTVFLKFNNNIVTKTDSIKRATAYAQQHFESLIKTCLEGV